MDYGHKSSERGNAVFRRSLYFVRDLAAGEVIMPGSVRSVRPGFDAAPKHLDAIFGRRVRVAVQAETPVQLDQIEGL